MDALDYINKQSVENVRRLGVWPRYGMGQGHEYKLHKQTECECKDVRKYERKVSYCGCVTDNIEIMKTGMVMRVHYNCTTHGVIDPFIAIVRPKNGKMFFVYNLWELDM